MATVKKLNRDSEDLVERELAEALARYTDPDHPEYDPAFTEEVRRLQPHWFEDPKPSQEDQHRC
jgi:hypothetical protein